MMCQINTTTKKGEICYWDSYGMKPNPEVITLMNRLKEQGIKFIDAYVDVNNKRPMLLISDPGYWLENENNIISWAKDSDIIYLQEGMILSFNSNEDKMMFLLRWS